jgi:hypothetical protein
MSRLWASILRVETRFSKTSSSSKRAHGAPLHDALHGGGERLADRIVVRDYGCVLADDTRKV